VTTYEPVIARLPPDELAELRRLARESRIPMATYIREAVTDLLAKYRARSSVGAVEAVMGTGGGLDGSDREATR
jgi:dihydrodipicolinate synthase/N-acetylneuraminate lyase